MKRETKELVAEVLAGIALYALLTLFLSVFFFPGQDVRFGLLLGMGLAMAMFLSMAATLDKAMQTGNLRGLSGRTVMGTIVRYLLLMAVFSLLVLRFRGRVSVVAVLIGLMGLKIGVFLQPSFHRIRESGRNRISKKFR